MNYPTHDTDWSTSAKGNFWKRINGKVLVVGKRKDGKWWALRDGTFVPGSFDSKSKAMAAAESAGDQSTPLDEFEDLGN